MRTPTITLGHRLALAREEASISVGEMAERLGVVRHTITRYERGQTPVPPSVLWAYAGITDVSLDWLRGEVELTQEVVSSRCTGESPCQGTLFAAAA